MSEPTLKPCPFCGADVFASDLQVGTKDREGWPIHLFCDECGAGGPWVYSQHDPETNGAQCDAIEAWNRRAEPQG